MSAVPELEEESIVPEKLENGENEKFLADSGNPEELTTLKVEFVENSDKNEENFVPLRRQSNAFNRRKSILGTRFSTRLRKMSFHTKSRKMSQVQNLDEPDNSVPEDEVEIRKTK